MRNLKKQISAFYKLNNSCGKVMSPKQAFYLTASQIPFVHVNCIDKGDIRACIHGLFNLYRSYKVKGKSTANVETLLKVLAKKKVKVILDSETLDYLENPKRLFEDYDDNSWLHDDALIVGD